MPEELLGTETFPAGAEGGDADMEPIDTEIDPDDGSNQEIFDEGSHQETIMVEGTAE